MATPNATQLERLKRIGVDPTKYKDSPQAAFDIAFPPEPDVQAAPEPEPLEGGVGLEPAPMTPEPGRVPPVDLERERASFIESRARDPLGTLVPEREQAAAEQADAILEQSFTTGGDPTPFGIFQPAVDYLKDIGGGELLEAFTPQTIQTPEQTAQQNRREFQASQIAAQSLLEEYQMSRGIAGRQGDQRAIDFFDDKIKTLRGKATDDPLYRKRRRQIIETGQYKKGDFLPDRAGDVVEFGKEALQAVTTEPGPGGELIESPALYTLRTLAAPVSAAAGVGERVGEEVLERAPILFPGPSESVRQAARSGQEPLFSTMAERVKEGTAVMGVGTDIADFAAEAAGLSPQLQKEVTEPFPFGTRYIGGGAGLLVDFALKPFPGSGAVGTGFRTTGQARQLGRALSLPRTSAVATGAKAAARRAVSDVGALIPGGRKIKLKGRNIFPEFVEGDLYADTLARYAGDASKQGDAAVFLQTSSRLENKGLLDDWAKLTPDQRRAKLVTELGDARAADFERLGKELGVDAIDDPRAFLGYRFAPGDLLSRASLSEGLPVAAKRALATNEAYSSAQAVDDLASYARNVAAKKGYQAFDDFMLGLPSDIRKAVVSKLALDVDDVNTALGTTYKDMAEFAADTPRLQGYKALTDLGDDAQRAVIKQFLIDSGNVRLREVNPFYLPNFTRLTRNAFLPDSQVAPAVDDFNKAFGKIRDKAVDQIEQGAKDLTFEAKDLIPLREYIDKTPLRFMPEDDALDLVSELSARLQRALIDETDDLLISVPEFNALLERGLNVSASKQPGYKSLRMVADDLQDIGKKPTAGLDLEFYRSKVLTPKELAGGSIENAAKGAAKTQIAKTVGSGEPTVGNPLSEEFISQIGQKFGAIEEDFKRRYRQARALLKAEGKPSSPPEAWAKVVSDNYVRDVLSPAPERIFLDLSYSQMFEDYVTQIYGGYESMVDALNASGRSLFLDKMLVNPAEMRQLVHLMLQGDDFKTLRQTFIDLQMEGKHTEALTVLRDTHAYVQGKPIQTFIKSEDELKALYKKASMSRSIEEEILEYLPLDPLLTKPYKTDSLLQDGRGMFSIWDNAKESAPMFLVDDHVELLATQYSTRRMAGIVEEVFDDWSRTNPELFPVQRQIEARATLLGEAFKEAKLEPILRGMGDMTKDVVEGEFRLAMPRIYVAAIEDQLTHMSGSTVKGKRLNAEIDRLKKRLIRSGKGYGYPGKAIGDRLFDQEAYSFIVRNSGANSYVSSIYPSLRAESTPLFFNTLKTSLRQASRSTRDIIRTGFVESALRAPLTFGETSNIRQAILKKSNIDQFTDTMMEMRIGSQFRKASPELLRSLEEGGSLTEKIQRGIDATTEIRQASDKARPKPLPRDIPKRLVNMTGELVGTGKNAFNDGRFSRIAKGGVLGGNLLPNFRYLTTNYTTAPAIVYGSLGLDYGGAAAKAALPIPPGVEGLTGRKAAVAAYTFDLDTHSVMKAITGQGNLGAQTFIAGGDFSPSYRFAEEAVLFVHPNTGKAYTNYELARIVGENGITRSQASAELTQKMVEEFVSYSGIEARKLQGVAPQFAGGNLKAAYRGGLKQTLKEDIFPAYFGNRQMNMFSEMANLTDAKFRIAVFIKALRNGETEANALLLARESLFDYGNLSAFEKQYINKIMWFWTFRRNSYRQVMKSFLTNPERMKNSYLANNYFREVDRDYTHDTVDYAKSRPFMALIDNKESKQRYSLYGPGIPQLQATGDLMDYLSAFPVIAEINDVQSGRKTAGQGMSDFIKDGSLGIAEQSRPSIQFIVAMSFGVDPSRDARRLGTYLDPRLMWYLQQNPDAWSTFSSMVNVEAVPREDEKPSGGYYQGRQWRLKRGDDTSARNWYLMQQVLLTIGIQRTARDYAPALETLRQGTGVALGTPIGNVGILPITVGEPGMPAEQRDIRLGGTQPGGALENMLYTMGVTTPIEAPDLQTRIRYNERVLRDALRENTK
jgi:hypothetical protein